MRRRTRLLTLALVVLLVSAPAVPALAVSSLAGHGLAGQEPTAQETGQDRGVDSREEVEAFVDAVMAEDLNEHHVSGATVSVVKDGELLFAEGYGYADRRNRTPVAANRTMFRIGSVSKLFAWTAVAQQVERGELDTSADVNRYLDRVRVPEKYGEPVTLEHLATHTAGFEEQLTGVGVRSPEDVRPLGETLQEVPARVRPPGEVTSYSNYGAALAGHIAAKQAGTPFNRYAERELFAPLDMTHSTFRQPVPAEVPGRMSEGYVYQNGRYVEGEFETIGIPPAGSMSATSTDMANFMIAHLQDGRFEDSRILSASATERMHRQHFANHPALNGMAFGFYEQSKNGVRVVGHGGDTQLFHSGLWLMPERNLGVFVSYNSVGGVQARQEFYDGFMDRFFPTETPVTGPTSPTAADGGEANADGGTRIADPPMSAFTGAFRTTRISDTDFTKIAAVNGDFRVRVAGNGGSAEGGGEETAVLVTSRPGRGTQRWIRTGPTLFEEVGGDGRMAFRVEEGRASYVFFDDAAPQSFERIGWWETTAVQGGLFGGALLILASALLGWPTAALWRRFRGWRRRRRGRGESGLGIRANGGPRATDRPRALRWLAGFAGLLAIGFVVGFLALLLTDPFSIVTRPPSMQALLAVPVVFGLATLGVVAGAVLAWTDRYWGLFGRVHYTLVAVALVVVLWQLAYWNMLTAWL
ncbi:serine hydrolase domain-containing protein [Halorussus lipolyticus]|uniref:serine hydrolase domain-containing protein n=1 Tax=Halorussus lipolyticus TaxID=3034024 RepID=UPI0023E8262B|nr:serine hydrolase domain-containing protein [Halorussus sp. DT80]